EEDDDDLSDIPPSSPRLGYSSVGGGGLARLHRPPLMERSTHSHPLPPLGLVWHMTLPRMGVAPVVPLRETLHYPV
ncbi:hypothetical protein Pcinc_041813, partial [Petrolisthes cinctipes]